MGSEVQSNAQGQKDGITEQTLWPKLAQLNITERQEWEQTFYVIFEQAATSEHADKYGVSLCSP